MNTAEKVQKKLYLLFIALILVTMLVPMVSAGIAAASDLPADSAVQFLYREYTLNGLHNADAGVGCYAFYILRQAGVDVSTWVYNGVCLKDAVWDTVYGDLQDSAGVSAKTLAQDLVAAQALGRNDLADRLLQVLKDRQTADGFDPGEWSIFANMPAFDLVSRAGLSSVVDTAYAKSYILGTQNTSVESVIYGTYGSWGCVWGGSFYPDFMTTAQAVRALYFLDPDKGDSSVQTAIYNGLEWMKGQQRADGSFASGWDDPVVDTAEAIVTLKLLGIDPVAWRSSEGKSPVDYLATGALNPDGSFGTSKNAMDATWMLSACNALGVEPTVLRFYLDPAGATLNTGDKTRFKAVWRDIYGQEMDVTGWAEWSVEDNGIASVDNDENKGLVTALSAGQTVVRAVYGEGAASAVLTVKPPAGNGGGQTAVNAGLAVVGKDGELLYGPAYISVAENNRWGLTALGILDASGLSYHTSNWDWGVMVDAICGQANSGMAGWMYAVNGEMPMCGPEKYLIKTGDKVIWYYSKSMDQQPPEWDDLAGRTSSGGGQTPGLLPAPVSEAALIAAIQNAASASRVVLSADEDQTALGLPVELLTKIAGIGKPLTIEIQGMQFVFTVDDLKVPELSAAGAAQLQVRVQKLSGGDVQDLVAPFTDRLKPVGDVYELDVLALNRDGTSEKIKRFPGCQVVLPVPEAAREAAAAGRVQAYRYNEDEKVWEEAGGSYDAAGAAFSFKADRFSKYALMKNLRVKTFTDITGHWAQKEIEFLATKEYLAGVGSNRFAPDAVITRAEFGTVVARLAKLSGQPDGADRFADVPAGAWYRGMVGAAARAGLVRGVSEKRFAPNVPVTREQMAVMIARFMAQKGLDTAVGEAEAAAVLAGFSDAADISSWARHAVTLVVRQGIMQGRAAAQFAPSGRATRAEAAVVLYRVWQQMLPAAR